MKTIREQFSHHLCLLLAAPVLAVGFDFTESAMGAPTTAIIRFAGADIEGRQNVQLDWNADVAGNYLVQSADDLSSSNNWQTIDSVSATKVGPVRWMAPESLRAQKFYRLVVPQPEIFSVAPGVVDTTIANQYLYILGQCLPTNADVVIDGIHFTPEIINSNGVWARILLNNLPPGQPVLDLSVVDLDTTNTVADYSHPFLPVDASSPYLLEPPTLPPGAPVPFIPLKGGAAAIAGYDSQSARHVGGDWNDGNTSEPEVMPFSGEVQACAVDMCIPGRGLDFVWARTYRSRTTSADGTTGSRWTSSYDISVASQGNDMVIHDGTGRTDTYFLQTNGVYACPGFFREGSLSNNIFRLTFADTGYWEFNPFDGSPTAGKLAEIVDRNGNTMSLGYDGTGRLVQIVDDLGRTNTVSYNPDGQLAGVTDFSGRTVTYAYYQSGEIGGNLGDLKSVTSPPVTGTPNQNDFPQGKTTTYTYSTGYTNDLENHLLLSAMDADNRTVRQFAYQHNQGSADFLRCLSVQCGTNTPTMISYLPQIPNPTNQFAVMRCLVNDPVGDVTELFCDARNRCVTRRDFTGRAVPGLAVTDGNNRPTGKLRPSDPDYYDTRWTWNDESLCTSIVLPGGNSEEMLYQRSFNQTSSRSNKSGITLHDADLLVVHEYTADGNPVDLDGDGTPDLAERTWRLEYDPRFGTTECRPIRVLTSLGPGYSSRHRSSIRNGDETGIDCGGLNGPLAAGGANTYVPDDTVAFEDIMMLDSDEDQNDVVVRYNSRCLMPGGNSGPAWMANESELKGLLNEGPYPESDLDLNDVVLRAINDIAFAGNNAPNTRGEELLPSSTVAFEDIPMADSDEDQNDVVVRYNSRCFMSGGNSGPAWMVHAGELRGLLYGDQYPQSDLDFNDVVLRYNSRCFMPDANSGPAWMANEGELRGLLYEDQWPCAGDADFNDVVLRYPISITDPRGNVTTADYSPQGNLLRTRRKFNEELLDQRKQECLRDYNPHGQLTTVTNAADASGYRRVDTFSYYTNGPQAGYLQSITIDESGAHLTTSFEHNSRGNVTRCVDPLGNDWLYTYNSLNQCVRCETPTNLTARCATDFFYDENNNPVQTSTEVRDAADVLAGYKVSTAGYDRLHRLLRVTSTVDSTHAMTNDFIYDDIGRCVEVLGGDAVSGADPHQTMSYEYDERGLLFHEIAAAGSPLAATNEYDYDANGSLARVSKTESLSVKQTTISYDGFERPATITDPMGNQTVCFYDANNNLKTVRQFGETNDVPGSAGNIRLAETHYDYDGLDRCVRAHQLYFNPTTQASIGDGECTTSFGLAPNGECYSRTNDLGHVTTYGYDTVGRPTSVTSPESRTSFAILLNGNGYATNCIETDLPDLGGNPQVFSRSYAYDSLNRCVRSADDVGNTMTFSYDSLGRCVQTINPRGVRTFYRYDLLGRRTQSVCDLDGDGVPDLADDIVQTETWSSSSDRLLATTDTHTNTTSYAYDTLGNCTRVTYADGTQRNLIWSPRSNLLREEDANGSIITNTYDLDERLAHRDIIAGTAAGVAATTTYESFDYDGCSRLTGHHNDDCDDNLAYDSLGHCRSDTLNGLTTTSSYDTLGNRLSLTSPGGRTLSYRYDTLERCSSIMESGKDLATYAYDGPGRLSQITFGNGTVTRIFYDGISGVPNASGDYGCGQISRITHSLNGAGVVSDCTFEYDANQNKGLRSVLIPGVSPRTNVMAFQYDRADRLTETMVADNSLLTRDTVYHLDRLGNRTNVTGAACSGDYTLNATVPEPQDYQMNQYTTTPCDARTYDSNGNLSTRDTTAGSIVYQYDYANLLVAMHPYDSATRTLVPVADYRYDALGRRIAKTVYSGNITNVTQFFYDGSSVIEERENGSVTASFVLDATHSQDDGVISMRHNGKDYYRHSDDQDNAVALTDANGAVVERYEYDDYGAVTFLGADGTPLVDGDGMPVTSSPMGNEYCWSGFRLDSETGLQNDDGCGYVERDGGRYVLRAGVSLHFERPTGFAGDNPWSTASSAISDSRMAHLHAEGIVHRDIAARNFLTGGDVWDDTDITHVIFNPREYVVRKSIPWRKGKESEKVYRMPR